MAKGNGDEFDLGSILMRVVFSLAIVFLTFNPTGHSYYHWLQQNLTPIQPVVVIAGILLLGAWLFFIRSTFSSMGTVGVGLLLGIGMSWAHIRARISGQASVDRVDQYSLSVAPKEIR